MAYEIEIRHDGLNKYRLVRGADPYVVEQKARAQTAQWNDMWSRVCEREAARKERAELATAKEAKKDLAAQRTKEAEQELSEMADILRATLTVDDTIDWEELKDHSPFPEPEPTEPIQPKLAPKPQRSAPAFTPDLTLLDKIIPAPRRKREKQATDRYLRVATEWSEKKRAAEDTHATARQRYEAERSKWTDRRSKYLDDQRSRNDAIDRDRALYQEGSRDAIVDYCELVLARSSYRETFPKDFDVEYVKDTRSLIIDYVLPNADHLPTLKSVRYVQSRDEFVPKHASERETERLYDSVLYQIALRTLHEVFEADAIDVIDAATINGWVKFIDKATGKDTTACILSLQAAKQEFIDTNLAYVDPKSCFKALKGVGSSKLHRLAPVAPIVTIQREDARFVAARGVVDDLDDSDNLAAMDWEDFEHLIRELFEKEFATGGGEVKVTRASRDGGVDAIAFDPDPIRGGKIVIQAKRYTKTVGVAAVRDLYGTVLNEGATKGILVSTADYGPDAYKFAKGKPLTLLNGANLLHLLSKHGYRAKIDLAAAREQLGPSKPA